MSLTNFKKISNQFTNMPLKKNSPLFRGRTSEFKKILDVLSTGGNISIVGERKIGKTSLLWNLEENLWKDKYIPIFIDMLKIACRTNKTFLIKLSTAISNIMTVNSTLNYSTTNNEIYDKFLIDIENYQKRLVDEKKIVIMIDEIENLKSFDAFDVMISFLKPLCSEDKLLFVFAGYDNLFELDKDLNVNLFGVFEGLQLKGISPDEGAISLINSPFKDFNIKYEDGAIDYLLRLTGRNPFYLQMIQKSAIEILNYEKRYSIFKNDYERAEHSFFSTPTIKAHFRDFWKKTNEEQRLLLSVLACKDDILNQPQVVREFLLNQEGVVISDINDNFERLCHLGFIYKEEGEYSLSSLLLKKWIRENAPIGQIVAEYKKRDSN